MQGWKRQRQHQKLEISFSVVFQDKTIELIQVNYTSPSDRGWGEEMEMCFSFDLLNKGKAEFIKRP